MAFETFGPIDEVGTGFISALAIAFHESLMTHETHLVHDFISAFTFSNAFGKEVPRGKNY